MNVRDGITFNADGVNVYKNDKLVCVFTNKKKDGEYDYGSFMRPKLIDQCPYCRTWQHFKAIVRNGALEKLESTTPFTEEELEQINEEFR